MLYHRKEMKTNVYESDLLNGGKKWTKSQISPLVIVTQKSTLLHYASRM